MLPWTDIKWMPTSKSSPSAREIKSRTMKKRKGTCSHRLPDDLVGSQLWLLNCRTASVVVLLAANEHQDDQNIADLPSPWSVTVFFNFLCHRFRLGVKFHGQDASGQTTALKCWHSKKWEWKSWEAIRIVSFIEYTQCYDDGSQFIRKSSLFMSLHLFYKNWFFFLRHLVSWKAQRFYHSKVVTDDKNRRSFAPGQMNSEKPEILDR